MKSDRNMSLLQEPIITEREGRYVIPVKVEHKREIKGIIHDISNTGATVFLEPFITVDMGNELRQASLEEKQEIERILSSLSAEIASHAEEISTSISAAAVIDFTLAKARYAEKARANIPAIAHSDAHGAGGRILKLVNARHPLLKGTPVPLTIEIGRDYSILVITGPNTGGKTVALKTIGLLALMTQAGIPIPAAAESCMPVFNDIFADIGDEQSIEQTLSTFSWHMGNITSIINMNPENSLVLLDELGTSTDPAEGAALAQAILSHFLSTRTMLVATTHFTELKIFAHKTPGITNASLDFDAATFKPTYRLSIGMPGGSNALNIAANLGLPAGIIDNATQLLSSSGTLEMETVLKDVLREKQRAEDLQNRLALQIHDAERLKADWERSLHDIQEQEQKLLHQSKDRLLLEASQLQRLIRDAAAQLKKEKKKETLDRAKQALTHMHERLDSPDWREKIRPGQKIFSSDTAQPAVGDTVRLAGENLIGVIASINMKDWKVEVHAGNARLTVDMDDVEKIDAGKTIRLPQSLSLQRSRPGVPLELDLRGKRVAEIEGVVDAYLNDAFLSNLSSVSIIHGYGTGAVRQTVREMLASHPLVKSYTPGKEKDGGDGVTHVSL